MFVCVCVCVCVCIRVRVHVHVFVCVCMCCDYVLVYTTTLFAQLDNSGVEAYSLLHTYTYVPGGHPELHCDLLAGAGWIFTVVLLVCQQTGLLYNM